MNIGAHQADILADMLHLIFKDRDAGFHVIECAPSVTCFQARHRDSGAEKRSPIQIGDFGIV